MLMDSGHIQETDVVYVNKKRRKDNLPPIEPLYTRQDAQASLSHFFSVGLERPFLVADGVEATFHNAGHILGSAWVALEIREFSTGKQWRLIFSGDVGRPGMAILKDPALPDAADILILESTYGSRLHPTRGKRGRSSGMWCARRCAARQGDYSLVCRGAHAGARLHAQPARGGRRHSHAADLRGQPLAVNATEVFRLHPEEWDEEVATFLKEEGRRNPFDATHVEYVRDVVRSKKLNYLKESAIIISANGMAENGRILHHLKNNIEEPENTILIVSFQAEHTLGRKLASGARVA